MQKPSLDTETSSALTEAKHIVAQGRVSNTNGTPGNAITTIKIPESVGLLVALRVFEWVSYCNYLWKGGVDYVLVLFCIYSL